MMMMSLSCLYALTAKNSWTWNWEEDFGRPICIHWPKKYRIHVRRP